MSQLDEIRLVESRTKRLQRVVSDVKFWTLGKLSRLLLNSSEVSELRGVKTFCCFVGHGRSGGTLVGALLNAHPNIVMSNELNAVRRLRHGLSAQQLFRLIHLISRRQARRGSKGGGDYTYQVPGQWQGSHEGVIVVGDRKAGATAYEISRFSNALPSLIEAMDVDIRFIHVVRHPLDKIATTFQKTCASDGETGDMHLKREILNYFARSRVVLEVENIFGSSRMLHLHHELLISRPSEQLTRLCYFLGVSADQQYVEACASILMKTPRRTRHKVDWSEDNLHAVRTGARAFPWLDDYQMDLGPDSPDH